jgi:type IV secretory pathway TrbL component
VRRLSIRTLSAFAAMSLVVAMTGVAQASSPNVVTAIKAQDKVISRTAGLKEFNHLDVKKLPARTRAKRLIADFGKLEKTAARGIAVVSKASTTSARQKQGKAFWIAGSREQTRAIRQLQSALKNVLAGDTTAAKTQYRKAIKTFLVGTILGIKGDKLLGLPDTD